jgi:hypothetical protein
MAHTGLNNGFYFDPEVFADYMQEQSTLNNVLIDSGVVVQDATLAQAVGGKSNIGTIPFFLPVDAEPDALNDDGETDNTPTTLSGSKQTFMAIARMKSWKENTFVRYLTGKSPLQNLASGLVVPYWKNQWEKILYAELKGIMGVKEMASHKTDLSVTSGSITDANLIGLTSDLDLGQKALGDKRSQFKIFVCNSAVAKRLRSLSLTENVKYFSEILNQEVEVTMYGGMILRETDTGTVDTSVEGFPVYHSYMLGTGAFLTCDKQVYKPYGTYYDNEKNGGVDMLFTKQAKVLHPNGFSLVVDNIAKESPKTEELANPANWALKFNHKNVPIAELITNG